LFDACFVSYLAFAEKYYEQHVFKLSTLGFSFNIFGEFIAFENKFMNSFRKDCISVLLYPLIFRTLKQQASPFKNFEESLLPTMNESKFKILKSFGY
jgi:hypothetical protein